VILRAVVLGLLLPSMLAASSTLCIRAVDTSFFPKITLTVRLNQPYSERLPLLVIENDRLVRGIRVVRHGEDADIVTISYLSAASGEGRQSVVVDVDDVVASATFQTSRGRRYGPQGQRAVSIRATGPDFAPIPCRLVLVHENGMSFEDFTTPGGYGRLASGFVLPPGRCYAELRLLGLGCSLDHFRFDVRTERNTRIHRRFGLLDLGSLVTEGRLPEDVFVHVERVPSHYPSISGNLAELSAALPDGVPPLPLPIPAGTYLVTVRPARPTAVDLQPAAHRVDVTVGRQVCVAAAPSWN